MSTHNPYQTPNSEPNVSSSHQAFAHHAFDWFKLAWKLYWQKPFMWMILTFLLFAFIFCSLFLAVGISPILVIFIIVYFIFIYYCSVIFLSKKQFISYEGDIADVMVFISENLKSLSILFITFAVMTSLYLLIVLLVIYGTSMAFLHFSSHEQFYFYINTNLSNTNLKNLLFSYFTLIIYWILLSPIMISITFTPMLVIMDKYKIVNALKLSFHVYFKNIIPLTLYMLIYFMLSFVVLYLSSHYSLLFLLVLFIFLPLLVIGISMAYCHIFNIKPTNHHTLNEQNN